MHMGLDDEEMTRVERDGGTFGDQLIAHSSGGMALEIVAGEAPAQTTRGDAPSNPIRGDDANE